MKKWGIITGLIVIAFFGLYVVWNYMIPSQDIQKSIKNMRADAAGLDRSITHCVSDNDCMTWRGVTKIYPFPDTTDANGAYSGGGGSFSFTLKGKKIICGPGWRIIEN